ncbi:hypothetical protein RA210_U30260 [Rubrivivax sp. A210]|uniref:hypothetical protein n=1 Tax=Rubrivivax sp. A210 TaxID=2772301 RepID=UPI001918C1E3|nr:hypothetical protein [Rubrivivax sp. A210]CAD5373348.1 hypothetical protein RA210_U30260 [Rubrivivax sp. A210]
MSPLWKSELRLRLGPGRCQAALWSAGLRPRCLARAASAAAGAEAVEAVLVEISAQGLDLPRRAVVLLEDELLYYAVLPAAGSQRAGLAAARSSLAAATGDADLVVASTLLAGGRLRLAAAVGAATVERLRAALAARDVALHSLQAALPADLARLPREAAPSDGVLALLRSEGLTLVGLRQGQVADLAWERCDLTRPQAVVARVAAYHRRWSGAAAAVPVLLVPAQALQAEALAGACSAQGWGLAELSQEAW